MALIGNVTQIVATLQAGDTVASLSEANAQILLGSDMFTISNQTVVLTQAGADFIAQNGHLPILALQSAGGQEEYLVTRAFAMSDDVNVKPAADPAVKDFTTLQVRTEDASASNHSITMLKTNLSGMAEFSSQIMSVSLNLWTTSGNNVTNTGGLDLFRLEDAEWSEDSLTASPYDGASATGPDGLHAAFAAHYGVQSDFATGQGFDVAESAVHFDLTNAGLTDGNIAFALLSDGGSTGNYWLHSSETASVGVQPSVTVTYATETPVRAVDDALQVSEGGSSIGFGVDLLDNDIVLDLSAARSVTSVNGVSWDDLALSTHDLFSEAGSYRAVEGSYGTLYIQEGGRAFYEHDGANLEADVQDSFAYTFTDGVLTSTTGQFVVDIAERNQAPELTLSARSLLVSDGAAAAGDVVASFTATDPDNDGLLIGWTNDVTPTDDQGAALYEIDAANLTVVLTDAGAVHVNAGGDLPKISLTLLDDAASTGTATASATPHAAHGNVWFIDQANGDDANAGNSLNSAFASIEAANAVVGAGDTVFLVGTYQRSDYNPNFVIEDAADIMDPYVWNSQGTFRLRDIHGTQDAPITYRGWDDSAKIIAQGNAGFQIDDSSHIRVENLEVVGLVDALFGQAEKLQFVYRLDTSEGGYDQSAYRYLTDSHNVTHDLLIGSDGGYDYFYRVPPDSTAEYVEENFSQAGTLAVLPSSDQRPSLPNSAGILSRDSVYVEITENYVHHMPGTGIRVQRGEYVNVIGNEVHDTTRSSSLGTQAVVVQDADHNIDVLEDQSNLYKIIFADNEVYNNFNGIYSWVGNKDFITPHLDEGNGVSPQWITQQSWIAEGATGRILIADNTTYLNGMAGISNHAGDRVVVVNNTGWMNASYGHLLNVSDKGTNGGIVSAADTKNGVEYGDDIWFYNNLSVANGQHNGGNHFAIRVNADTPRVNDAGGRISGPVTFDGAANAGFDIANGPIKFDAGELSKPGFIYDTTGLSTAALFVDPSTLDFRGASSSPLALAGGDVSGLFLPDFVANDIYDGGAGFAQIGASGYTGLPVTTLAVGPQNLSLTGDAGANALNGGSGADTLLGLAGDDTMDGAGGTDRMEGGSGNDTYIVDDAGDTVIEQAASGVDLVRASVSYALRASSQHIENLTLTGNADLRGTGNGLNNTIIGNDGNNILNGAWGNDTLIGGAGHDRFKDDSGVDRMEGGTGNDTYFVDDLGDSVIEQAAQGYDRVFASVSYALRDTSQHVENLRLTGSANLDGTGNVRNNIIVGNQGDNLLNGAWGNDTLIGGAGDDRFIDDHGADRMVGGSGNDTYVVDHAGDRVIERSSAGYDKVFASVSYSLRDTSQHVENLRLTGSANLNGTGNGRDNIIAGNQGDNLLNGAWGNDTLIGDDGNDTFTDDMGADRMIGGTGADVFYAGRGSDVMLAGLDTDTDRFVFEAISDSAVGVNRDVIQQFVRGDDIIDLSAIDANPASAGDQAFALTPSAASHAIWILVSGADVVVSGDITGDAVADFEILVSGLTALSVDDFVL